MPHPTRDFCVPVASPAVRRCERPRYVLPIWIVFGIHPNKQLQDTYPIITTGGYQSSSRADSHAVYTGTNIVGDCKGLQQPARHIPNLCRTIIRPRENQPPIRRESDRADRPGVTLECFADSPLGNIPNLERQNSPYVEHLPRK